MTQQDTQPRWRWWTRLDKRTQASMHPCSWRPAHVPGTRIGLVGRVRSRQGRAGPTWTRTAQPRSRHRQLHHWCCRYQAHKWRLWHWWTRAHSSAPRHSCRNTTMSSGHWWLQTCLQRRPYSCQHQLRCMSLRDTHSRWRWCCRQGTRTLVSRGRCMQSYLVLASHRTRQRGTGHCKQRWSDRWMPRRIRWRIGDRRQRQAS
jgi:hypothetical protein